MSEKLLVPDIGDFEEVEVIEILVKQGDEIKKNDIKLSLAIYPWPHNLQISKNTSF